MNANRNNHHSSVLQTELRRSCFQWLCKVRALREQHAAARFEKPPAQSGGRRRAYVQLTVPASLALQSGLVIGRALDAYGNEAHHEIVPVLKQTKADVGAREHNWHVLASAMRHYSVLLDPDKQRRLVNGDASTASWIVERLHKALSTRQLRSLKNASPTRKSKSAPGGGGHESKGGGGYAAMHRRALEGKGPASARQRRPARRHRRRDRRGGGAGGGGEVAIGDHAPLRQRPPPSGPS